ncbi:HemX protein [Ursidibacter maritimus]|nr:uroporphyrinogen-III C-methyltransferase [Ursidibacter maritimus]KAE9540639.1 HemX protein [Ursidibacter maritimus]
MEQQIEQQAVTSESNFAKETENVTASEELEEKVEEDSKVEEEVKPSQEKKEKQKSGGKAIAILALLIALGIGGAGHFFANKKFSEVEAQIEALKQQVANVSVTSSSSTQTAVELPNFEAEKAQLAQLTNDYQKSLEKIAQLEHEQSNYAQQINGLQLQLKKIGSTPKADTSAWLLSDADFLLNNALRKMVLDNDIDTAKNLLVEADNALSQVTSGNVQAVRDAIKADLKQIASVNKVDQNNLMQRLANLANKVDDMPMLDNDSFSSQDNGEVSDSLADWQKNIEKSADSFLSHFIRVSDKNKANEKAFIAPNQEIYLRENIRLRLQIAILAVPRQQNELYKQSLEAVGTWVRSYFDVQNNNVKQFLKEIDDLIEQSIYIDAPNGLQSLSLLEQALNKTPEPVQKIQLDADKTLEQLKVEDAKVEKTAEEKTAEQATEQPANNAEQPANAQ